MEFGQRIQKQRRLRILGITRLHLRSEENWELRASGDLWPTVAPNEGHKALAKLQEKLLLLITQNVDGLHQLAGSPADRIVEIHGNTRNVQCLDCDYLAPMEEALERVRNGEEDPHCEICGGLLKSATISFGQSLIAEDLLRSEQSIHECDLLMAIGTTLTVGPINRVVPLAHSLGKLIIIVNGEPTEYDNVATYLLKSRYQFNSSRNLLNQPNSVNLEI